MIWLYAVRWRLVFISAVIATTALRMTSAVKASNLLIFIPIVCNRWNRRLGSNRSNSSNRSSRSSRANRSTSCRWCHLSTQHCGRPDVKLETASLLVNHHAVVASGRFHRHVAGLNIGENAPSRTLERIPESAAAGGLDRKAIALVNLGRFDFASRELINLAIFARDKNSVGQRVLAAVEAPRRANCAFHVRVNRRRPAHAHFVRNTQAAAKFSRAAGVLP